MYSKGILRVPQNKLCLTQTHLFLPWAFRIFLCHAWLLCYAGGNPLTMVLSFYVKSYMYRFDIIINF